MRLLVDKLMQYTLRGHVVLGITVDCCLLLYRSAEASCLGPSEYLSGSYCMNSNTPFAIKPSISCRWDFSNGFPGVVIIPSCRSFIDNSISACSLLVMKAMEVSIPSLIAVMNYSSKSLSVERLRLQLPLRMGNCSLKSLSVGHLRLQLPLRIVITGQILLRNPGSHPRPQC
jgi:hypothetical protein